MSGGDQVFSLAAAPLLPWAVIAGLASLGLLVLAFSAWRRARGWGWRALALAALLAALINPALIQERREQKPDEALLLTDDSPSIAAAGRQAAVEAAAQRIRAGYGGRPDLSLRELKLSEALGPATGVADDGTLLLRGFERAVADMPRRRFAGAILITDGRIHDRQLQPERLPGPIHALIAGRRDEADRRLSLVRRPSFALVDRDAEVQLRVDDPGQSGGAALRWRVDGGEWRSLPVPLNREISLSVPVRRGGETLLEAEVAPGPQELTLANNRVAVPISGVRDRLRVLLISGEPHPGERVWRSLLKSDPAVDLVHFTILRPPEKQDGVPSNELSLIAFPVRELFEEKLRDFDLVIFDRYRSRSLIPASYLRATADYVRAGGAVLESAGPSYASSHSLFLSPMGEILPGAPTGRVLSQPFMPEVTTAGRRHPVTADLTPPWGRWLRQVELTPRAGVAVMGGAEGLPLLLLDRVGEGRTAQLASDHIWLWRRGFEGGGPDLELLRRIVHWLMREPALEEDTLIVTPQGARLAIERRSLTAGSQDAMVTDPAGKTHLLRLTDDGRSAKGSFTAEQAGLHRVESGPHARMAAVGTATPLELADVRATDAALKPVAAATGGGVFWSQDPPPALRRVGSGRPAHGADWLGLVERGDFEVLGTERTPLAPPAVGLAVVLGLLGVAWGREGRYRWGRKKTP